MDKIEFFVYLVAHQPAPFIAWAHTPLKAIEIVINDNIYKFPGMFAKETELLEPRLHFRSLSGIFVKDKLYPVAEEADWQA